MIVYGDILFAENMIMGSVLLYITGQIHGKSFSKRADKLRLLAGSILCGVFSLVIFLPVKMPVTVLMELLFSLGVCMLIFGSAELWKKALTFILATYFTGGMIMALLLITNEPGIHTAVGVYTGDMKAAFLALFAGMALFTAKTVVKTVEKKKLYQQYRYHVSIASGDVVLETEAFLDTGNCLTEPLSGKPVAIADERLWSDMEKRGMLKEESFRVVPYETVGTVGILMAVKTDYIELGEKRMAGCLVAKGNEAFSLGEYGEQGCQLLLSKDMADR